MPCPPALSVWVRDTESMEQESVGKRARRQPEPSAVENRLDALTSQSAERVLKRAIELQSDSDFADPTLDPSALERVAAELGIDVGHVRQALLEEFSRPEPRSANGLTERIFAPRTMSTRLVATASRAELDHTIDAWMTKHEGLRPTRRTDDGVAWVKNPSPINSIRQGLKISQGTGALRTVRQVTHQVESISEGQHVVSLEADTKVINQVGVGLVAGGAFGSLVTGGVLAAAAPMLSGLAVLGIALAILSTFLIAAVVSAKVWAVQVEHGLERAGDGIAHTELMHTNESVPQKIARVIDEFRDLRNDLR